MARLWILFLILPLAYARNSCNDMGSSQEDCGCCKCTVLLQYCDWLLMKSTYRAIMSGPDNMRVSSGDQYDSTRAISFAKSNFLDTYKNMPCLVSCPLPPVYNGASSADCGVTLNAGIHCHLGCLPGYHGIGYDAYCCRNNLQYSGICEENQCTVQTDGLHVSLADSSCPSGVLSSGKSCALPCSSGFSGNAVIASCKLGELSFENKNACKEESCSIIPVKGASRPCSNLTNSQLPPGASCQATCDPGYVPNTLIFSCSQGQVTQQGACVESSCEIPTPPSHTSMGSCSAVMFHGQSCQFKCDSPLFNGYISGECNYGTLDWSGSCDGSAQTALIAVMSVVGLALMLILAFVIYRRIKRQDDILTVPLLAHQETDIDINDQTRNQALPKDCHTTGESFHKTQRHLVSECQNYGSDWRDVVVSQGTNQTAHFPPTFHYHHPVVIESDSKEYNKTCSYRWDEPITTRPVTKVGHFYQESKEQMIVVRMADLTEWSVANRLLAYCNDLFLTNELATRDHRCIVRAPLRHVVVTPDSTISFIEHFHAKPAEERQRLQGFWNLSRQKHLECSLSALLIGRILLGFRFDPEAAFIDSLGRFVPLWTNRLAVNENDNLQLDLAPFNMMYAESLTARASRLVPVDLNRVHDAVTRGMLILLQNHKELLDKIEAVASEYKGYASIDGLKEFCQQSLCLSDYSNSNLESENASLIQKIDRMFNASQKPSHSRSSSLCCGHW